MPGPSQNGGGRGGRGGGRGGRGGRGRGGATTAAGGQGQNRRSQPSKQQAGGQRQQQQQEVTVVEVQTPEQIAAAKAKAEALEAKRAAEAKIRAEQAQKAAEEKAAAEAAAAAEAKRIAEEEAAEAARLAAEKAAIEAKKTEAQRTVEAQVELVLAKKADAAEREAAVKTLTTFVSGEKIRQYEPFVIGSALEPVIVALDDKVKGVREACAALLVALPAQINPHAVALVVDTIVAVVTSDEVKWRAKEGALKLLTTLAESTMTADSVARCLPKLVPALNGAVWDTKKQVLEAARVALKQVLRGVPNRDLEPFVEPLFNAMVNPEDIPETVQTLASTTFVQSVDAMALAVIAPILVRGFRVNQTSIKRQCCVIVTNMSKLVEDHAEAAPFLPELLPALDRAADTISDPEARAVATRAHEHLDKIKAHSTEAIARHEHRRKAMLEAVNDVLGAAVSEDVPLMTYVEDLCTSLIANQSFDTDSFKTFVTPTLVLRLEPQAAADAAPAVIEANAKHMVQDVEEEDDDAAELLCNLTFTLAYGSKILLHNTGLKLLRGYRYGLLGANESGKTTLMRSIANGSIEGFPDASEVRTVFVESDIQGEMSHLACIDYIFADPAISTLCTREAVEQQLLSVGFTQKMVHDGVSTLSGGWRMKLALARAMLQKADILLMDEPTNHLDVLNVKWVEDYLNGLKDVTCIMVSHDPGLLENCATHIIEIKNFKLHITKGNLSTFVERNPDAKSYFELKESKQEFHFPQPSFLEGVKSKGKALMKMQNVAFTYPGNDTPTLSGITVQVSLSSRVACLGVNGAGKSTMIKLLTGVLAPCSGTVWKYPNVIVNLVAQHAFAHIEMHLGKTANEYIRWRFEGGKDKEGLDLASMKLTEEEEKKCLEPFMCSYVDGEGNAKQEKRIIERLTGGRRQGKSGVEYEVKFVKKTMDSNMWMSGEKLDKLGFSKHCKSVDAQQGTQMKPLTQTNVEEHLENVGLDREYGTHSRMSALSGGQKVKVVLAAATWNQPHILILDEPTNYLDRDSLGALAGAIREFEGGVVMVTHNNEFCSQLCPETWVLENGLLNCKGDAEWMANALKQTAEFTQLEEMVDAVGNKVEIKKKKKNLSRKEKKARAKRRAFARANGEVLSDSDEDDE